MRWTMNGIVSATVLVACGLFACGSTSTGDKGGSGGSGAATTGGSGGTGGTAGASGGSAGAAGGGITLPTGCWTGTVVCNPTFPANQTECPQGYQCDLADDGTKFVCRSATPSAPTGGQPCIDSTNFCAPGFVCDQKQGPPRCGKMCCGDADCGPLVCTPLTLNGGGGSMGFCSEP
jgi:hypothetical protein